MNRPRSGCYSFIHRPDDLPGETKLFEHPNDIARQIKFPPTQSMSGAAGLGMMVIVVSLAKTGDAYPKIIPATIGCCESSITERRHVADRIDRPGDIIDHQHRHIEAPKHSRQTEREVECGSDSEVR